MLSRSHLLIDKELTGIYKSNLWGIEVSIINDNIYEWSAKIHGPIGTHWEGGIFRVYLKFDEHYNCQPPRVCFHTIPYHPNIDMITGQPCIDYLDDYSKWSGSIKIASVLVQIQNMLGNPILSQAINAEAADMLINSPEMYKKVVSECVEYSKQIDGARFDEFQLRQHSLQPREDSKAQEPAHADQRAKVTKLSFDDYFAQWNGIATTKPAPNTVNTYLETVKENSKLQQLHYGMSTGELLEEDYDKQVEYDNVYYGSIHQRPTFKERSTSDPKLAKISQMRKIYLPKKPLPTPRSPRRHSDSEGEIENLLAWTQNLNPDDVSHL
ncbi:ubiquitin-conjugating enzyme E2 U-like [Watersipora subatra]|uniref:ubiquitin-conjugating enzyme E2 U-like n=1 Tax=Watersipora subatra TaxID=2589382 RepID=UPI00355C7D59